MTWFDVVESRRHAMKLLSEGLSAHQVGEFFGVSRQTVQKWKKRFAEEGAKGLGDRSHAPIDHPSHVSAEMEKLVLKCRRKYREGPRKLRMYLIEQNPQLRIPAASTIGLILHRHGRTEKRAPRRGTIKAKPTPLIKPTKANELWCIDFKGEFRVGSTLCFPLTITDGFSRFSIATTALSGTAGKPVQACLWRAFGRYGLPKIIRSDNGAPFSAIRAPLRLSTLAVLWLRLGIRVEHTDPGCPYQNGAHERFHKTLKHQTAKPPAQTFEAQQKRFDRFREHYNKQRPHEALQNRRPAELYAASPRTRPSKIPPIEHPDAQLIRTVSSDGRIQFQGHRLKISKVFCGETVGLTEIKDDIYEVQFGEYVVAHISFRAKKPRVFIARDL